MKTCPFCNSSLREDILFNKKTARCINKSDCDYEMFPDGFEITIRHDNKSYFISTRDDLVSTFIYCDLLKFSIVLNFLLTPDDIKTMKFINYLIFA